MGGRPSLVIGCTCMSHQLLKHVEQHSQSHWQWVLIPSTSRGFFHWQYWWLGGTGWDDLINSNICDLNVTQKNVLQATGVAISNEQRKEVTNVRPMSQPIQDANEGANVPGVQTSHNLADGNTGGTTGSNVENIANNNPASNIDNTANNNSNIQQTSEYRSKNSQNQPYPNTQQYTNTMPYTI